MVIDDENIHLSILKLSNDWEHGYEFWAPHRLQHRNVSTPKMLYLDQFRCQLWQECDFPPFHQCNHKMSSWFLLHNFTTHIFATISVWLDAAKHFNVFLQTLQHSQIYWLRDKDILVYVTNFGLCKLQLPRGPFNH